MLCEKCKTREANTHLTTPLDESGKTEHHFCEVCYPAVEAERNKAYNTQTPRPLRVDVESMTAEDFVEVMQNGQRNSADRPAMREMFEKLSSLSHVRERLVFEAIPLAWKALNAGEELPSSILTLVSVSFPKDSQRVAEHTAALEKMIFKAFELRKALPYDPGKHGPFCLTLLTFLTPLGVNNPDRFEAVVESLKAKGADPATDERWNVIALVKETARKKKNTSPGAEEGTTS